MNESDYDPLATVLGALGPWDVEPSGKIYVARCPAHDGGEQNLHVGTTATGKVWLSCKSHDCGAPQILDALGLGLAHLYPDFDGDGWSSPEPDRPGADPAPPPGGHAARYVYRDEHGNPLAEVVHDVSNGQRAFRQYRYVNGQPVAGLAGLELPLFRLDKIAAALAAGRNRCMWITEGEKDARNVQHQLDWMWSDEPPEEWSDEVRATYRAMHPVATTTPGGASRELTDDWCSWADRFDRLDIAADDDEAGYRRALKWLDRFPAKAHVCAPLVGKDVSDHLAAGHGLHQVVWLTPTMVRERLRDIVAAAWPEPAPLGDEHHLPHFPQWLAGGIGENALFDDFVSSAAQALGAVDRGLVGMTTLSTVSTACQGRFGVEIRPPGWVDPTVLWNATVAWPGAMKSPALRAPLAALEKVRQEIRMDEEQTLRIHNAEHQRKLDIQRKLHDRYIKICSGTSTKADAGNEAAVRAELDEVEAELAKSSQRFPFRLYDTTGDLTPAKLASNLHRHGSFGILAHEGAFIDQMAGMYSDAPDLSLALQCYDGDAYDRGRVADEQEIYIERPLLTLGIMLQEGVLTQHARQNAFRDRGFWQRISFWRTERTVWDPWDRPIPATISDRWDRAIAVLTRVSRRLARENKIVVLRLLPLGRDNVVAYRAEMSSDAMHSDAASVVKEWSEKAASRAARIAANLHLIALASEHDENDLYAMLTDDDTTTAREIPNGLVSNSLRLVKSLRVHIAWAVGEMRRDRYAHAARMVAGHIIRHRLDTIQPRDVINRAQGRWRGWESMTADDAQKVLGWLQARSWVERSASPNTWNVNPRTHELAAPDIGEQGEQTSAPLDFTAPNKGEQGEQTPSEPPTQADSAPVAPLAPPSGETTNRARPQRSKRPPAPRPQPEDE